MVEMILKQPHAIFTKKDFGFSIVSQHMHVTFFSFEPQK